MTANTGKDLLLQHWDSAANDGAGDWVNVAGLRDRSFNKEAEVQDITTPDDDDPAGTMLHEMSMVTMIKFGFEGQALIKNKERYAVLNNAFLNGVALKMRVIEPNVGNYVSDWIIESLSASGAMSDPLGYDMKFKPSDKVEFTAI